MRRRGPDGPRWYVCNGCDARPSCPEAGADVNRAFPGHLRERNSVCLGRLTGRGCAHVLSLARAGNLVQLVAMRSEAHARAMFFQHLIVFVNSLDYLFVFQIMYLYFVVFQIINYLYFVVAC